MGASRVTPNTLREKGTDDVGFWARVGTERLSSRKYICRMLQIGILMHVTDRDTARLGETGILMIDILRWDLGC